MSEMIDYGGTVRQLVHFETAGRLACSPHLDTRGVGRSDDPRAVNCRECLKTADCRRVLAEIGARRRAVR